MDIKKAKNLVSDIIDICTQLGDESLDETCSGIYNDIQAAKDVEDVISSASELMVFVNETSWDDFEFLRDDIEKIYVELMEEYDEF